jgi:uncharacterized protein (DUF58 family)
MRATLIQMAGAALIAIGVGAIVGYALGVQFGASVSVALAGVATLVFGLSEED